jgi:hypothetical protein
LEIDDITLVSITALFAFPKPSCKTLRGGFGFQVVSSFGPPDGLVGVVGFVLGSALDLTL